MIVGLSNPTFIERFRQLAARQPLSQASKALIEELGFHVNLRGAFATRGPQLIVANHPSFLDPFVLLAHIPRDDVHIVTITLNRELGPQFEERLLPIYLSNMPADHMINWLRIRYWTFLEGNLSRQEATWRNRDTIRRAAELVSQRKTVIIFPSGIHIIRKQLWSPGIGFLIKHITNPDTQIVLTNLNHRNYLDVVRYWGGAHSRKILRTKTVEVETAAIPLPDQSLSGKEITHWLHQHYHERFPEKVDFAIRFTRKILP